MGLRLYKLGEGESTEVGVGMGVGDLMAGKFAIPCNSMTEYFRNIVIGNSPLAANSLGLFTIKGGINTDTFKLAGLNTARHLFSSRKDNCQFVPKGKVGSTSSNFTLNPFVYDGVQCPDEMFGSSWEQLFGTSDPLKMFSSKNGMMLIQEILSVILSTLHNDFWNMVSFGANPIIDTADTNKTYVNYVSAGEWTDFKDQMDEVGGFVTAADYLKTAGRDNFSVPIQSGDVSGASYTGAVSTGLFPLVREAQLPKMKIAAKNGYTLGKQVWLVTRGIFEKYKAELIAANPELEVTFMMKTMGIEGAGFGKLGQDDILMWDGKIIVCFDQPSVIDEITGYNTHMVLATLPGNIPILYGNGDINGFGLMAEQTGHIKDKGKVFMTANGKVGTGFINPEFVSYAVRRDAKA